MFALTQILLNMFKSLITLFQQSSLEKFMREHWTIVHQARNTIEYVLTLKNIKLFKIIYFDTFSIQFNYISFSIETICQNIK